MSRYAACPFAGRHLLRRTVRSCSVIPPNVRNLDVCRDCLPLPLTAVWRAPAP